MNNNGKLDLFEIMKSGKHWILAGEPNPLTEEKVHKLCENCFSAYPWSSDDNANIYWFYFHKKFKPFITEQVGVILEPNLMLDLYKLCRMLKKGSDNDNGEKKQKKE